MNLQSRLLRGVSSHFCRKKRPVGRFLLVKKTLISEFECCLDKRTKGVVVIVCIVVSPEHSRFDADVVAHLVLVPKF